MEDDSLLKLVSFTEVSDIGLTFDKNNDVIGVSRRNITPQPEMVKPASCALSL